MSSITVNEVRKRLSAFSKQWQGATSEKSQAQTFWLRFYECFGIRAESATIYEQSVKKLNGATGYIDSFIPGKLIVEHKSAGKKLEAAFDQASEYFVGLKEHERPRFIIVSDFKRFVLHDLLKKVTHACTLAQLSKNAGWFTFLVDDAAEDIVEESPINRQAAYAVSQLHEELLRSKFKGRDLEVFLTRLLFCFFADDTGIFGIDGQFRRIVEATRPDGRDTGARLSELFDTLNTDHDNRQKHLDEALADFAYVNGSLFAERTRLPAFNSTLRALLVACAELDWSAISPAIFGAMFQGVLEAHEPTESRQSSRRELGAHYTSERNILRVINPLFMESLRAEFAACTRNKPRLKALYDRLPTLRFMDPACGCGNFLVIAFRELRRFENDVIERLFDLDKGRGLLDVSTLCRVRVSQFYGIEIDEAAAHIARVAMWITDHQMNTESAARFGNTRPTVPLVDSPTIAHANALRVDWTTVLPPAECSYIMGNPPFVGHQWRNAEQVEDMNAIWGTDGRFGRLDYVTCWHAKAAQYMRENSEVETALVSTNSICQGEQVGILWSHLLAQGAQIRFGHRTFKWSNEGKGNAAVHCVIVGFALKKPNACVLVDYIAGPATEGVAKSVSRINPYLVDAPDVILPSRTAPPAGLPQLLKGSQPTDGGHLILTAAERQELIAAEPGISKWLRSYIGGEELINGQDRYCLWLKGISASELRKMPLVAKRVRAVAESRRKSPTPSVQQFADQPTLFTQDRQPTVSYLAVPEVSSEARRFIPIDFLTPKTVASNKLQIIPGATHYHFAVLSSTMHNAWMRAVCGRMKSDYSYSPAVYNNFPWATGLTETQKTSITDAGKALLIVRADHPKDTLADLYDVDLMPPDIRKAHQAIDKAVDAAYGYRGGKDDASRVAFLFERYQALTSLLPPPKATGRKRPSKMASA